MTDIVKRLRAPEYWFSGSDEGHEGDNNAPVEAADTIDRMRAALRQIAGIDAWDDGEQGYVDKARAALQNIEQDAKPSEETTRAALASENLKLLAEIDWLRSALTRIYAWYPISISQPRKTLEEIREFAYAALEKKA